MAEARRTIDLLWFPDAATSRRGRRPGLSVHRVVTTAIVLADTEGLEAVTMRRIAQGLEVVPMTLYTYVPDKATLLELMLDRVYLDMPRPSWAGRPWRQRLTAVAEANRALYDEHPWAAEMPVGRPLLGPGLLAKYDHELSAFTGAGLGDVETDAALTFLLGFVQASARVAADVRAAAGRSAQSDSEWWAASGPRLATIVDPAAFPHAARIGTAAGQALGGAYHADHAWAFGLDRVLDGLGVLIEQRASDYHR